MACRRCLNEGGILVMQNGTPFMQIEQVITTAGRLRSLFPDWHFCGRADLHRRRGEQTQQRLK